MTNDPNVPHELRPLVRDARHFRLAVRHVFWIAKTAHHGDPRIALVQKLAAVLTHHGTADPRVPVLLLTIEPARPCLACGQRFLAAAMRRHCSDRCRRTWSNTTNQEARRITTQAWRLRQRSGV